MRLRTRGFPRGRFLRREGQEGRESRTRPHVGGVYRGVRCDDERWGAEGTGASQQARFAGPSRAAQFIFSLASDP